MFLLEMATLLLGIGFIAAGTIQSRKTGQKNGIFHSCRYCSGSDQRIFIYLYDLAFVWYPDPGTGNRALF